MTNDPVIHRLADLLSADPSEVERALDGLARHIRSELTDESSVVIDGLGTFTRSDGGIALEPETRLNRFFNRPYESLEPVIVRRSSEDSAYQKTDIVGASEEDRDVETGPQGDEEDVVADADSPSEAEHMEEETRGFAPGEVETAIPPGDPPTATVEPVEEDDARSGSDVDERSVQPATPEPAEPPPIESTATEPAAQEVEAGNGSSRPHAEDAEPIPQPVTKEDSTVEEEPRRRPFLVPVFLLLLVGTAVAVFMYARPIVFPGATEEPVAEEQPLVAEEPPVPPEATDEIADEQPPAAEEPAETLDPLRGNAIRVDEGGFTWIFASLASSAPAEEMVQDFRRQGFRSGVIVESTDSRTFYRVGVGQFQTQEGAIAAREQLPPLPQGTPGDPWLRRIQ